MALRDYTSLPDVVINPFRFEPPEGQMLAIKNSTPDGSLDRFVASVPGRHFRYQERSEDPNEWVGEPWDKWDLLPDLDPNTGERIYTPPEKSMPRQELGIMFVGFSRALFIPQVKYAKLELLPGSTDTGLVRKDRNDSPFFFFQYNLAVPIPAVESEGNVKTTIRLNIVARLVNPYRALFLSGGWESLLASAVHGAVREFLGPLSYNEIKGEKEAGAGSLAERVLEINENFRKKFGVEIDDVRFESFDVVNTNPKVEASIEAGVIARNLADAAVHDARRIETIAAAEAKAATLVAAAYGSGEAAAQVRSAELIGRAITETGASVVSIGGNPVPVTVPIPPKK